MNPSATGLVAIDARLAGTEGTGDSTYWLGLLNGLAAIDVGLTFLLFSNAARPPEIPEGDKFRWITLPSSSSRYWSLVRFPLAARRAGARAMHTQYNLSPLVGKLGITTVHDVSFFIGPEWFQTRDLMLLRRFVPSSVKRAAKVITVSETSKSEIESHIPAAKGKVTVTLLARRHDIQPVEDRVACQVLHELAVQKPYVLAVGTRWPRKNMDLAVQACALLPESLPHKLLLTGKAGWGEVATNGRTLCPGFVSPGQLSALYSAADAFLLPSFHEGFGLTLLEAFACGCPVICSSGGALPEIAGDAAVVMPNWDLSEWARAIGGLLGDPRRRKELQERGKAREGQFSWDKMALETVKVYGDVVNRSGTP